MKFILTGLSGEELGMFITQDGTIRIYITIEERDIFASIDLPVDAIGCLSKTVNYLKKEI